jgi:hypothetical protein
MWERYLNTGKLYFSSGMYLRKHTASDAKGKTLASLPPWEHQISGFLTHLISHYQTFTLSANVTYPST